MKWMPEKLLHSGFILKHVLAFHLKKPCVFRSKITISIDYLMQYLQVNEIKIVVLSG